MTRLEPTVQVLVILVLDDPIVINDGYGTGLILLLAVFRIGAVRRGIRVPVDDCHFGEAQGF
jgi:hypothetical protein